MSAPSTPSSAVGEVHAHALSHFDHISLRLPGDAHLSHDPKAPTKNDFKMYTMDLSYFCGKLEMYFRYKQISFDRIEATAREYHEILFRNTGSEQVPQVYDTREHIAEEHRWLRDTTPLIEYLEKDSLISRKSRPVIPDCPVQAFFQRLVEDYADEFLWRPAMWWRWEPGFDRFVMGYRFTYEFARDPQERYSLPRIFRPPLLSLRQWLLSCYGEDVTTKKKKQILKEQYYELLDILQEILDEQPFLFGQHPTLVDFGFAGPFFRHFSSDFTPRKVMQQRAPAVYQWMATLWNSKCSRLDENTGFPAPGFLPDNWQRLLGLLPDYLNYYHLNAKAYADGKSRFAWVYKGETFVVPVVHYRAWCRQRLQQQFLALDKPTRGTIEGLMRQYECWDLFWADGVIPVDPECGTEPPFALYPPPLERKLHLYKWEFSPIFYRFFFKSMFRVAVFAGVGYTLWRKQSNKSI